MSCSQFPDGDHWPNGTAISEEMVKQMGWVLPDGSMPIHLGFQNSHVLDIRKPMAQQYIEAYAKAMIDAGIDAFECDEPTYIMNRGNPSRYGVVVNEQDFINAWLQIVGVIKSYAKANGKNVLTYVFSGWMNTVGRTVEPGHDPLAWPGQDIIEVSFSPDTVNSGQSLDDWGGYKVRLSYLQLNKYYSTLPPIMVFLDWGNPGDTTPLAIFGSQSLNGQVKTLRTLSSTCLQQGWIFVYPLHGGVAYAKGRYSYDATEAGTLDTIISLTNQISTVHTLTETTTYEFMSSTTLMSTTTSTITENGTATKTIGIVFMIAAAGLAGFVIGVTVVTLRRRRTSAHH